MYESPESLRIEYAARMMVRRCLENPDFDDHPAPVIANERDRMLDENISPAVDFALRNFARRLLNNPDLEDHAAPVISEGLDRFLNELQPESDVTPVVIMEARPKGRAYA